MQEEFIRQQLVRYEALFSIMNEALATDDVDKVAKIANQGWKYIANVTAWRAVVEARYGYIIVDGSRNGCEVSERTELSEWDAFHWQLKVPRIMSLAGLDGVPSPPEHLQQKHICDLQVTHYRSGHRSTGLLTVASKAVPFDKLDDKVIRLYGKHLTDQISNIVHRQVTIQSLLGIAHDHVTGLLNQQGVTERLDVQMAVANRTSLPLGIFVVAIENFEDLLGSFGRTIGETILSELALRLRAIMRKGEILGRIDADKFALVFFPSTKSASAASSVRIRQAAADFSISDEGSVLSIPLRLGIVTVNSADVESESAEQMLRMALAKFQGNRYLGADYSGTEFPGTEYPGQDYPGTEYSSAGR